MIITYGSHTVTSMFGSSKEKEKPYKLDIKEEDFYIKIKSVTNENGSASCPIPISEFIDMFKLKEDAKLMLDLRTRGIFDTYHFIYDAYNGVSWRIKVQSKYYFFEKYDGFGEVKEIFDRLEVGRQYHNSYLRPFFENGQYV